MIFSVRPALAGYPEGVLAFEGARYNKALTEFRPLAARGHAGAEFMLGVMNFQGKGVAQNKLIAAVWFHKAAQKGHAGAQLAFGSVFIRGIGVYQDISKAYMWLTLAVESNVQGLSQQATNLRDDAKKLMTPSEINAAQQAARKFKVSPAGLVREN
jgi:TPR repeat protein